VGFTPPSIAAAANGVPAPDTKQFSVSTQIFDAQNQQLLDRHLVLFDGVKIYSFAQTAPRNVMVIDPILGRVTLLSRKSQEQTRFKTENIAAIVARVRVAAKNQQQEAKLGIGAKPVKNAGKYEISFAGRSYTVDVTKPKFPNHATQFAEFTDWAARVNLVRQLGPPPFGRMALGRQMAADGVVPGKVTLTCKSANVNRTFESLHEYNTFGQADEKRIAEVQGMIALYRQVAPDQFPK